MSDISPPSRSLRERLGGSAEDRLGRALSDLLDSPLLTGAVSRAVDAREKAVQAQELAMGALNLPSAADVERLTRRLRSVSLRLEGIEDSLDNLDRALSSSGPGPAGTRAQDGDLAQRLAAIEDQLARLTDRLDRQAKAERVARTQRAKPARSTAKPAKRTAP
jgi:DNA-binding transcriptional MerR regulator